MFHNLARILSYMCWKYRVDMPPLPQDMQIGAKCIFFYSLPFIDCSGAMAKIWP